MTRSWIICNSCEVGTERFRRECPFWWNALIVEVDLLCLHNLTTCSYTKNSLKRVNAKLLTSIVSTLLLIELFIEIFLDRLKPHLICLLPLAVVLEFQSNRKADFNLLFDQSKGKLQNFHIVRYKSQIIFAYIADVIGLFIEWTPSCFILLALLRLRLLHG
jgi:hypothetical protein